MVYVNLICISFLLLLFFISKNYSIDEFNKLDSKQHPLIKLYPMALYITDKFKNKIINKVIYKNYPNNHYANADKLGEALESLYLGEKKQSLKRIYEGKKVAFITAIIFITNILSLAMYFSESNKDELIEGKYLERSDYGEGSSNANLHIKLGDDKELILDEDMKVEIKERDITEEEVTKILEEGSEYIDSIILLNNKDANEVKSNLSFPTSIPSKKINITWETADKNIVDTKGQVYNDQLGSNKLIWVKAILKLKKKEVTYTRYFNIYPKEYTKKEIIEKSLYDALKISDENTSTKYQLELPTKVGDKNITWSLVKDNQSSGLFILGILAAFLIYFFMDKDLWSQVDKKNQEMLLDYPDIINKFTLLVGAGMSLSNAWSKIASDYNEKQGPYKYAYEEMSITARELSVGVSEITAYEKFGRRVKLMPYLRFSSFLARNVKKGSKDLLELLELESLEAFEERKELAKRLGEEAGTKLLIPMMLMLVIVLAIILIPAFLSFQF